MSKRPATQEIRKIINSFKSHIEFWKEPNFHCTNGILGDIKTFMNLIIFDHPKLNSVRKCILMVKA